MELLAVFGAIFLLVCVNFDGVNCLSIKTGPIDIPPPSLYTCTCPPQNNQCEAVCDSLLIQILESNVDAACILDVDIGPVNVFDPLAPI